MQKNEILLVRTSVTNDSFHERRKIIDFKTKTCQDCHFLLCSTVDNTEKIWAHRFFAKQKRNVPKARKTSAGGLGGAVSPPSGFRAKPWWGFSGRSPKKFSSFLVRNEEKHRFRG